MDFDKLNLGKYQKIAVSDLPKDITLPFTQSKAAFDCLLAFVQSEKQVEDAIEKTKKSKGKIGLILVYTKVTSKKYKSQINRDGIIEKIKQDKRFKAPKLVSLDDDWSGFSFTFDSDL